MQTRRYSIRRLGCGACGCLILLMLFVMLACVGLFALVQSARAATPRQLVLLIDQSTSVLNQPATRSLVHDAAFAALDRLQQPERSAHAVEVRFFGASATTVITAATPSLVSQLETAFAQSPALGGTAFLSVFTELFDTPSAKADVILITDGIPDPVENATAYRSQMRVLAQQFAQQDIVVSALLVGSPERSQWLAMWQDFTAITGGVTREIRSADDISSAVAALPFTAPAPTPTPFPTAIPVPTRTSSPTAMPVSTPTATLLPTVKPTTMQPPPATTPPWPWVLLLVGTLVVMGGLGALAVMAHRPAAPPPAPPLCDEGTLEIFDPDREAAQSADLHTMALGEVWGIGGAVQCRLHVEGAEPIEQAALIMTPDGPLLEARGTPLTWDGRTIQTHLLFDSDELYLGRLIVTYQNFFRQRPPRAGDDEVMAR